MLSVTTTTISTLWTFLVSTSYENYKLDLAKRYVDPSYSMDVISPKIDVYELYLLFPIIPDMKLTLLRNKPHKKKLLHSEILQL